MRPVQARFITACQQLLALGVVLAVLTPAAGVAVPRHRRVARPAPAGSGPGADRRAGLGHRADVRGGVRGHRGPAHHADRPGPLARGLDADARARSPATRVTSRPQAVTRLRRGRRHLGARPGDRRGRHQGARPHPTGRRVERLEPIEYHDDHAPDADSPEAPPTGRAPTR